MSFFLGFVPSDNACKKIVKVSDNVKKVFEGFDIDARWSCPSMYSVSVVSLGENVSFLKMAYLKYRLKKFAFKKFTIKFGSVKLGITRRYKELVFLEVQKGGDDMRELCLSLRKTLKLKEDVNLIPHLTLGRVNKELSQQEYSNIVKDLAMISKNLQEEDITFTVNSIDIIKMVDGNCNILNSVEGI